MADYLQCISHDVRSRISDKTWPKGYKTFPMLNSAEHEIYPAHNVKMPTIVDILTFISMINTIFESLKAIKVLIFQYFWFYEQLKIHAQLS